MATEVACGSVCFEVCDVLTYTIEHALDRHQTIPPDVAIGVRSMFGKLPKEKLLSRWWLMMQFNSGEEFNDAMSGVLALRAPLLFIRDETDLSAGL